LKTLADIKGLSWVWFTFCYCYVKTF